MSKPFNPESTVFTNLALDKIMPIVSPNAWKILCFAIRKTAGWADLTTESKRKESDIIAISQFKSGCGIASNDTVLKAINECLKNGYLIRVKEGKSFRYRINQNYELPIVPENGTVIVPENGNTNSNINNKYNSTLQNSINKNIPDQPIVIKKDGDNMNKEEYLKSIEQSLMKGMIKNNSDYAKFTPDTILWATRFCELWNSRPPRDKSVSYWITSCRSLADACGEFGLDLLNELYKVYNDACTSHGGIPPFNVNDPGGLIKTARGFAAAKRRGDRYMFNYPGAVKAERQSRLDV